MSAFNPEIAARALMPKDFLNEASSIHFIMHLYHEGVQAAVAEASGSGFLWTEEFEIEGKKNDFGDTVNFILGCNWSEKVFRKCSLTYDTADFTLVPAAFFEPAKEKELFHFSTGKEAIHTAHIQLPELDAVMIFNQSEHIRQLIKRFPNVRIFPSAYLFVKYAFSRAERGEAMMHISHTHGFMLLAVVKDRKLLLLNHFDVQGDEDILYYASNAAMRLNIDFENVPLQVYEMPVTGSLLSLLKQYNRPVNIAFASVGESQKVKASFPAHLHILCA